MYIQLQLPTKCKFFLLLHDLCLYVCNPSLHAPSHDTFCRALFSVFQNFTLSALNLNIASLINYIKLFKLIQNQIFLYHNLHLTSNYKEMAVQILQNRQTINFKIRSHLISNWHYNKSYRYIFTHALLEDAQFGPKHVVKRAVIDL